MLGIDDISFAWLALIATAVPRRPPDFADVASGFSSSLNGFHTQCMLTDTV